MTEKRDKNKNDPQIGSWFSLKLLKTSLVILKQAPESLSNILTAALREIRQGNC